VAQLRAALVNSVTADDMQQIAEQLRSQARSGNLAAIKLLFQYVLGKPAPAVNPDTLDVEEWNQVYRPIRQAAEEAPETLMSPSIEALCGMVRIMQPAVEKELSDIFAPAQKEHEPAARPAASVNKRDNPPLSDLPNTDPTPPAERKRSQATGRLRPDGAAGDAPPSTNGDPKRPRSKPRWLQQFAALLGGHEP
jgi:hypothetical protein